MPMAMLYAFMSLIKMTYVESTLTCGSNTDAIN